MRLICTIYGIRHPPPLDPHARSPKASSAKRSFPDPERVLFNPVHQVHFVPPVHLLEWRLGPGGGPRLPPSAARTLFAPCGRTKVATGFNARKAFQLLLSLEGALEFSNQRKPNTPAKLGFRQPLPRSDAL